MGKSHALQIGKVENAEVVSASDINENTLNEFKTKFSLQNVYADYNEMLASEELDAVTVCLPTFLHHGAVVKAAEKRVHILCEKPLARTLQQGREMIQACKENRVILQIGFVRRFDNSWLKAKEIVESGILGKPVIWRHVRAAWWKNSVPWFLDKDKGGGPILDGMIHNFDFGNYIFGKPVSVASGITRFTDNTAIDTGSVWVEYESGNFMSNFWSWGMPEKVQCFSGMDMLGSDAALEFPNSFDHGEFKDTYDHDTQEIFLLKKSGGSTEPMVYEKNDLCLDQMKHFIDCTRNNAQPKVTGEDGLLALKVALAALHEEEL